MLWSIDIAASRRQGIEALAAHIIGVESGLRLVFDEPVPEIFIVDGSAAKAMNADHDSANGGRVGSR